MMNATKIKKSVRYSPSQIACTVTTARNVRAKGITRARKFMHGIDSSV